MGKRKRLSDEIAEQLGCEVNKSGRYRLSAQQLVKWDELVNDAVSEVANDTATVPNDYSKEAKPFVLSAWNTVTGLMMDIDAYCEHYNLPRKDITSYKLISHTGTPYFNIVFKELANEIHEIDFKGVIEGVIEGVNIEKTNKIYSSQEQEYFTRVIYTDTHIAMDTNSEGTSMYATKWDEEEIIRSAESIYESVLKNKYGNEIYVDDLGDFLDGWNGYTTRGGHQLPQNMTNEQAFRVALMFKMRLTHLLSKKFNKVVCHNITNDNHAGDFGAILNHAFKIAAEAKYDNVEVYNIPEFIGHYIVGKHCFVLSHGKDKKSLKFGFKPQLDTKQIEKIDHYLKYNKIYSKAKFIEFGKGDSHQFLLDYSTAQDFDYFNYPALSPASEWVQNNYKEGSRGFVIQKVSYDKRDKVIIPVFL